MIMYMTNSEIVRSYQSANNKHMQIGILADLNVTSRKKITEKLESLGLEVEKNVRHSGGRVLVGSAETRMDLYRRGLSDEKIGKALGVSAHAIYQWRKKNGLQRNHPNTKSVRFMDMDGNSAKAEELYAAGLNDVEIACEMGCCIGVVFKWRKEHGYHSNYARHEKWWRKRGSAEKQI